MRVAVLPSPPDARVAFPGEEVGGDRSLWLYFERDFFALYFLWVCYGRQVLCYSHHHPSLRLHRLHRLLFACTILSSPAPPAPPSLRLHHLLYATVVKYYAVVIKYYATIIKYYTIVVKCYAIAIKH